MLVTQITGQIASTNHSLSRSKIVGGTEVKISDVPFLVSFTYSVQLIHPHIINWTSIYEKNLAFVSLKKGWIHLRCDSCFAMVGYDGPALSVSICTIGFAK